MCSKARRMMQLGFTVPCYLKDPGLAERAAELIAALSSKINIANFSAWNCQTSSLN